MKAAFRKVALKVHPDTGVDKAEFQTLQAAKERWKAAAKSSKSGLPFYFARCGERVKTSVALYAVYHS